MPIGLIQEAGQRTRGTGDSLSRRQAGFVSRAASFDRHPKRDRHADRVFRDGDGGVDERRVGAYFHRFGRVAGRADPRVHHYRHRRLLDNDADLPAGFKPAGG